MVRKFIYIILLLAYGLIVVHNMIPHHHDQDLAGLNDLPGEASHQEEPDAVFNFIEELFARINHDEKADSTYIKTDADILGKHQLSACFLPAVAPELQKPVCTEVEICLPDAAFHGISRIIPPDTCFRGPPSGA